MPATAMNLLTVLSADLEATREFYVDFRGGFKVGWRPPFQFPGWWLYSGEPPILHVIHREHLPEGDRAGVLDHMAFSAEDLPGTVAKLKSRNISYDLRRLAGRGILQLFFNDPCSPNAGCVFHKAEKAPPAHGE